MSYHLGGLGQTSAGSGVVSIPPRSADLTAIQQRLVADGLLHITPDGVISSSSSPTLTALRSWATSHGLSATGVARVSTGGAAYVGGLALRRDLADALLGGAAAPAPSGVATTPRPSGGTTSATPGGKSDGAAPATPSGPLLPYAPPVQPTDWMPWAIGGGVALLTLGGLAYAATR